MSAANSPVEFPFWVLIPGVVKEPAPIDECGTGDLPLAFSTTEKMMPYMSARKAGDWRVRLVSHDMLVLLIAELHALGSRGICLDPEPDGAGGIEISLGDLMKIT
jgi:hypothetical protein